MSAFYAFDDDDYLCIEVVSDFGVRPWLVDWLGSRSKMKDDE